jgi:hypothetical protein
MVPSLYGIGLDIDEFFSRIKAWIRNRLPGAAQRNTETTTPEGASTGS